MNEEQEGQGNRQTRTRRVLVAIAVVAGIAGLSLVTTRSSLASTSTTDGTEVSPAVPADGSAASSPAQSSSPASVSSGSVSVSSVGNAASGAGGVSTGAAPGTAGSPGVLVADTNAPATPATAVGATTPSTAATTSGGAASTPVTTSGGPGEAPSTAAAATTGGPQEWTWTTFPVKLNVKFENVYDDNLNISHSHRVGDFSWVMIPSLDFKSRDLDKDLDSIDPDPENYLHFDYKPEFVRFLKQKQDNFIDQHADGNYLFSTEKLQLGLNGGYNTSHYPNVDFGGRLNASYYTASGTWAYDLTRRLTVGGDVGMTLTRYKQGFDTDNYTTSGYLDYQVTPKITLGLGSTAGYVSVSQFHPHQDYGQFYARASYQIREKVSLTSRIGVEYREYNGTTNPSTTDPSFALGLNYQPFDSTTFILEGSRNAVPAITQSGTNYYDTDVDVTWRQRLLQQVYFALTTTYEHDDYYSVSNAASTGLSFDYVTVRPSFEWDWNRFLKFNAYYEWQDNHSSTPFSGFYDNSVGIGANFSY
jgi:hypothetical protein